MGIFDGLLGKKKQVSAGPVCAICGLSINARPLHVGGVIMYEGTECSGCGKAFCLNCHNFRDRGPKCPNCGQWKLGPLMRAA